MKFKNGKHSGGDGVKNSIWGILRYWGTMLWLTAVFLLVFSTVAWTQYLFCGGPEGKATFPVIAGGVSMLGVALLLDVAGCWIGTFPGRPYRAFSVERLILISQLVWESAVLLPALLVLITSIGLLFSRENVPEAICCYLPVAAVFLVVNGRAVLRRRARMLEAERDGETAPESESTPFSSVDLELQQEDRQRDGGDEIRQQQKGRP